MRLFLGICTAVSHLHAPPPAPSSSSSSAAVDFESAFPSAIAHRDLKPANVLLTDDDVPVLMDFGSCDLARHSITSSKDAMALQASYLLFGGYRPLARLLARSIPSSWESEILLSDFQCSLAPARTSRASVARCRIALPSSSTSLPSARSTSGRMFGRSDVFCSPFASFEVPSTMPTKRATVSL